MPRKYMSSKNNANNKPRAKELAPLQEAIVDEVSEEEWDREKEYPIERLLDRKKKGRWIYYLVKWEGWPEKDSTWELKSKLPPQFVQAYEKQALSPSPSKDVLDDDEKTEETESVPPQITTPNRRKPRPPLAPLQVDNLSTTTTSPISFSPVRFRRTSSRHSRKQEKLVDSDTDEDTESDEDEEVFNDEGETQSRQPSLTFPGESSPDDDPLVDGSSDDEDDEDDENEPPPRNQTNKIDESDDDLVDGTDEGESDGDDVDYEVEKILEVRPSEAKPKTRKGKKLKEYLVKWKGWTNEYNEWLHEDDCCCPKLIAEFEERRKSGGGKQKKRSLPADANEHCPPRKRARRTMPGSNVASIDNIDRNWVEWIRHASLVDYQQMFRCAEEGLDSEEKMQIARLLKMDFNF